MRGNRKLYLSAAATAIIACLSTAPTQLSAQQPTQQTDPAIRIGDNDLGGIVTGPNGPEAGVWVIAETTELSTKMAKMVVTDDRGRYVLPDLPKANYSVWVRGYGLVDSPKVTTAPGKILNLHRRRGTDAGGRSALLPADLLVLDAANSGQEPVPRHGEKGNGMPATRKASNFGSIRSRATAASVATNWAMKPRARFRRHSGNSRPRRKHGRGASSPARRARAW